MAAKLSTAALFTRPDISIQKISKQAVSSDCYEIMSCNSWETDIIHPKDILHPKDIIHPKARVSGQEMQIHHNISGIRSFFRHVLYTIYTVHVKKNSVECYSPRQHTKKLSTHIKTISGISVRVCVL